MDRLLSMPLTRPGRKRLFPSGFEKYGTTLEGLASYVAPLIFEDKEIGDEFYGIAGTCFLVRYRRSIFAVTAQHCLSQQNGDNVRIGLNLKTKSFLPLKKLHRAVSQTDEKFADIALFEVDTSGLSAEENRSLHVLEIDSLSNPSMQIEANAHLVVPGYPKCLNGIDYDLFVIQTQCYVPSGKYLGPSSDRGIHRMEFDELSQIDWPDGMSGSPVFLIEDHPEAHFFGLHGILIEAKRYGMEAKFIGADVLFLFLNAVVDAAEKQLGS